MSGVSEQAPGVFLGLDTAAGQCGVALVDAGGAVLVRRVEAMRRGHAEALFPLIDAALDEAGARYADLCGIAVCTGPGSFTGIRIGVAAARGLALGLGLTAVGVDRFRALALGRPASGAGEGGAAIALAGPYEAAYFRTLDASGQPCPPATEAREVARAALGGLAPPGFARLGDAWPEAGEADGLADPAAIARVLLAGEPADSAPRPFYLRDAGAAPPREAPVPVLDR